MVTFRVKKLGEVCKKKSIRCTALNNVGTTILNLNLGTSKTLL